MKKLLLFMLFVMAIPTMMVGEEVTIDGIKYDLIDKGKMAKVLNGLGSAVVIPATLEYNNVTYTVTIIAAGAFASTNLTSIEIPNSVTIIEAGAFARTKLTSIEIPNSVTSIGEQVLEACHYLTSISVAPDNTVYDSRDDCNAIIETSTNRLIIGCKNTVIPEGVRSISQRAFYDQIYLTSVDIPNSVRWIGKYAFYNCSGLTSVTIPNSVTSIDDYAFKDCSGLTSVTFGSVETINSSACQIGMDAFQNVQPIYVELNGNTNIYQDDSRIFTTGLELEKMETLIIGDNVQNSLKDIFYSSHMGKGFKSFPNLKKITIGSGITDINYYLENSPELEIVTCRATTPPTATNFDGSFVEYATLIVPYDAYNAYRTTAPWSTFGTIQINYEGFNKIIVEETDKGMVTISVNSNPMSSGEFVKSGSNVLLSNICNTGYVFDHYSVTAADGTEITVTDNSFVMPSQDVTIRGVFRDAGTNTVTFNNNQEGGVLHVMQGDTEIASGTTIMEGTTLTLSFTLSEDYMLQGYTVIYTVTDGNESVIPLDETNSFTMPNTPVTINVTYKKMVGTPEHPYEISSVEDLVALANFVNEGNSTLGLYWIQTADIDISSISAWKPIGAGSHNGGYNGPSTLDTEGFAGNYDGQGHVISGAKLSDSESGAVGVFGIITGTVRRLGVTGAQYNASKDCRAGALVGVVAASSNSTGLVENCFVKNSSIYASSRVCGAIAGAVYGGVVSNSYAIGNTLTGARKGYVTGDTRSDMSYKGTVQYCFTNGSSVTSSQSGNTIDCEGGVSAARFASGEIAYRLNGLSSSNPTWYQAIGNDSYPVLLQADGNTVYSERRVSCMGADLGSAYNNDGRESISSEHKFTLVAADFDCVAGGNDAYNKCDYCSKMFDKNVDAAANPVALESIPAMTVSGSHGTCQMADIMNEDGLYANLCDVCGKIVDGKYFIKGALGTQDIAVTKTNSGYIADEITIPNKTAYYSPVAFTTSKVTLDRTFTSNVWQAWFAPFAVTTTVLDACKYQAAYINGVKQYDDDFDGTIDRTVLEVIYIKNGTMRAGTPYLVKALTGATTVSMENVEMIPSSVRNDLHSETTTASYDYIGSYVAYKSDGNIYSLDNSGALVRRINGANMQPLRWKMTITDKGSAFDELPASSVNTIYISVVGEEDELTGIRTIYPVENRSMEKVYDLGGRRLNHPKQGINIVNGKKVIIK